MHSIPTFVPTLPSRSVAFLAPRLGAQRFSRSGSPFRHTPRRARLPRMAADGGGSSPPPDGATITKALEVTFRGVWINLVTAGISAEYETAIEQFIVACVTAYKAGYSLTALKFELAANEQKGTFMGRDIRLNDQEKETRLIWIALVYMTLARYNFNSENTPPPVTSEFKGTRLGDIICGLANLVDSVCDAAKRGYNLQSYKMELSLQKGDKAKEVSPAEANVRSQWARIVFSTIRILPQSRSGGGRV